MDALIAPAAVLDSTAMLAALDEEFARVSRVVVGLPAGARHDLGVLAFAMAARRAGLNTAYLGPDLPAAHWLAALQAHTHDVP